MTVFVATAGVVFQLSPELVCPLEGYARYTNMGTSELAEGLTVHAPHFFVGMCCVTRPFILGQLCDVCQPLSGQGIATCGLASKWS